MPVERDKVIIACDPGDPISAVYMSEVGCVAGTMLGKVWLYLFEKKQRILLSAFADDSVKGVYMQAGLVFATIGDLHCRAFDIESPHQQTFFKFERRHTTISKFVLAWQNMVCVLLAGQTVLVDVVREKMTVSPYKMSSDAISSRVAPCDFDGEKIACMERDGEQAVLKVVHLSSNQTPLNMTLAPKSFLSTQLKLWGADCIVFVRRGRRISVYDYERKQYRYENLVHKTDIVALDCSNPLVIISLSTDGTVKAWRDGVNIASLTVAGATFSLGFPYMVSYCDNRVAVVADEGVFVRDFPLVPTVDESKRIHNGK